MVTFRKSKKRKKEKNTEPDGGESLEKKVRRLDMNPSEETRKVQGLLGLVLSGLELLNKYESDEVED